LAEFLRNIRKAAGHKVIFTLFYLHSQKVKIAKGPIFFPLTAKFFAGWAGILGNSWYVNGKVKLHLVLLGGGGGGVGCMAGSQPESLHSIACKFYSFPTTSLFISHITN
jgi:hypothetical protein